MTNGPIKRLRSAPRQMRRGRSPGFRQHWDRDDFTTCGSRCSIVEDERRNLASAPSCATHATIFTRFEIRGTSRSMACSLDRFPVSRASGRAPAFWWTRGDVAGHFGPTHPAWSRESRYQRPRTPLTRSPISGISDPTIRGRCALSRRRVQSNHRAGVGGLCPAPWLRQKLVPQHSIQFVDLLLEPRLHGE